MTQNNPANFIPFLVFLGFGYMGLTMGRPDRLPWEQPATANDGQLPIDYPLCIGDREPGKPDAWQPCTPEELKELDGQRIKIFNTLTNRWE